jgi:L-amino acid N-acyltransferase YncA
VKYPTMPTIEIRLAVESDAAAINDIYNHYVLHSTSTYQEQIETLESRMEWLTRHGNQHTVLVATSGGRVVGWAAISPFHRRSALRYTVENAVYVHPQHSRQGIGRQLMGALIAAAKEAGHHCIVAVIDSRQEPSIALHRSLGFVEAGRLREVGLKFGDWLDLVYMQKTL